MKKLKILFITTWYPTKEKPVGGVFVQEHAKAVRLTDDVIVLHCGQWDRNLRKLWRLEEEVDEDLTQHIPTFRAWYRSLAFPGATYLNYLWSVWQAFRKMIGRDYIPDIIHAQHYEAGVPAVLIGKYYGIPTVLTEHSTEYQRKIVRKRDVLKSRFAFHRADIVLPVSKSLQRAIEQYRVKAQFRIVPNVVDRNMFYPKASTHAKNLTKSILAVALLDSTHKKGIPFLFDALGQIKNIRNDWHLHLLGDGPARPEYEQLARSLGISEKVTFHGLKTKAEVAEFMRQADLFVLPSLFETFSVVVAEALTVGIPVLATHCGGPEEYIHKDVGLIVPPGNAGALSEGLEFMLNHLGKFNPSKISRYAIERFSPNRVGEQLRGIYLECIKKI